MLRQEKEIFEIMYRTSPFSMNMFQLKCHLLHEIFPNSIQYNHDIDSTIVFVRISQINDQFIINAYFHPYFEYDRWRLVEHVATGRMNTRNLFTLNN